jgi:hypothetical protein
MRVGERSPWAAPVRPSTSSSIMREALTEEIGVRALLNQLLKGIRLSVG